MHGSPQLRKEGKGVVMKRLWHCRLMKAEFLNLILIWMVCMIALWAPARANETIRPVNLNKEE